MFIAFIAFILRGAALVCSVTKECFCTFRDFVARLYQFVAEARHREQKHRDSVQIVKDDSHSGRTADLEAQSGSNASSHYPLVPGAEGTATADSQANIQNITNRRLLPSGNNEGIPNADGDVTKQNSYATSPHGAKSILQETSRRDTSPGRKGHDPEESLSVNEHHRGFEEPDKADTDSIRTDMTKHFSSEMVERIFLQKDDDYSEAELIKSCTTLNTRMNHLSGYLMKDIKENQMRDTKSGFGSKRRNEDSSGDEEENMIMQKALGERLYSELISCNGRERSASDVYSSIHDGLDAWSAFCMNLAMKPIFFGLRWRSDKQIDEIICRIVQDELELAEDWKRIKQRNISKDLLPQVESLVKDMKLLTKSPPGDASRNVGLENIYRNIYRNTYSSLVASGNEIQIALHWRALLFQHDLDQPSYKEAISETVRMYRGGIYRIFELADVEPPDLSKNHLERIYKVVDAAAILMRQTKTGVFSESIDTVLVEPGSTFNKKSMRSVDKTEAGKVKCTLQLGLQAVSTQGKRKLLMTPEVLLVV